MCPLRYRRGAFGLLMAAFLGLATAGIAQPLPDAIVPRNVRLQIQLDRVAIKAFEPVYLSVSAEQYAEDAPPEVAIRKGVGPWEPVVFVTGPQAPEVWHKFESRAFSGLPRHKYGTVLMTGMAGDRPRFLFSSAGDYKIRVKVGPDSTTLDLTVFPAALDDERAATILGPDLFPHMFENDFQAKVNPRLRDTVARVVSEFPGSTIANYCQAYLQTAAFRDEAQKHSPPQPNTAYYGNLADKLEVSASTFSDTFLNEELTFYAAYAEGLSMNFAGLLKTASGMQTHLTPWADSLAALKKDVEAHMPKQMAAPIPIEAPKN